MEAMNEAFISSNVAAMGSPPRGAVQVPPGRPAGASAHVDISSAPPPNQGLVWSSAIAAALLGGLLGWAAAAAAAEYVYWEGRLTDVQNTRRAETAPGRSLVAPDAALSQQLSQLRNDAEKRNAALALGVLGGVLGACFGAGGGLARGSARAMVQAGSIGALAGTVAGAGAPWLLVPLYHQHLGSPPHPSLPVVLHSAMYAVIGAAVGLAFAVGLEGKAGAGRGLAAGAMGGILGCIAFSVVHTVVFPLEWDLSALPGKTMSRLLAHLCVAVLAAACVVVALTGEKPQAHPKAGAPEPPAV
jgi:hypothetical protein